MASRGQIIGEINGEIESAINSFNESIPQLEKSLVRKINLIIKDLDLAPDGTIKTTIANLNKMKTIEREMATAFESSKYLGEVDKYTESYGKVQGLESKYFAKVLTDYSEPSIMNEIHRQAVNEVAGALTGSNIVANVIDPVNQLVRQGIESGVGWDDMRASINTFLAGADGGTGALTRYTTTITNDSLNTFARTYENTIANREGIEWFEYNGREQTNTREFCRHLDDKRWFHESEIAGFLKGQVGEITVPLYKKTGKPYGMKQETTEKNFVQLAGGWNCGHHASPVPTEMVPKSVRDRFKTTGQTGEIDGDGKNQSEFNDKQFVGLNDIEKNKIQKFNAKAGLNNDHPSKEIYFADKSIVRDPSAVQKDWIKRGGKIPPKPRIDKDVLRFETMTDTQKSDFFKKLQSKGTLDDFTSRYNRQTLDVAIWEKNKLKGMPMPLMENESGSFFNGQVTVEKNGKLKFPDIDDDIFERDYWQRTNTVTGEVVPRQGSRQHFSTSSYVGEITGDQGQKSFSTYIHEMGHYRTTNRMAIEDAMELFNLDINKDAVSLYGSTNSQEFFAEAHAMYYISPNTMKKFKPKTFEFAEYLIKQYTQ